MTENEQIDLIRDELSEWITEKTDKGFTIAQISIGMIEMGFTVAIMAGLPISTLEKMTPRLIANGQRLVTITRKSEGELQ